MKTQRQPQPQPRNYARLPLEDQPMSPAELRLSIAFGLTLLGRTFAQALDEIMRHERNQVNGARKWN